MQARLQHLRQHLPAGGAFFLTKTSHIEYYSGFKTLVPEEREGLLLVTTKQSYLFHGVFSPISNTSGIMPLPGLHPTILEKNLREIINRESISLIYLDKKSTFVWEHELITTLGCKVENLNNEIVDAQKSNKDEIELALAKKAGKIAKQAWKKLLPQLEIGQTELVVKNKLEQIMIELGSDGPAFPTIVAFGANAALPHHQPTRKKLTPGAVLVDFGATVGGYRSDMTRSLWFEKNMPKNKTTATKTPANKHKQEFLRVEKIVQNAYRAAFTCAQNGLGQPVSSIDSAARRVIEKAGYGKEFCHTTGHGVGLDIHEHPSINWQNQTKLTNNTIFTIEPGIYLHNKFGYRYENTLVMKNDQLVTLT